MNLQIFVDGDQNSVELVVSTATLNIKLISQAFLTLPSGYNLCSLGVSDWTEQRQNFFFEATTTTSVFCEVVRIYIYIYTNLCEIG